MFISPMLASPLPNKKRNPKAKDFILEPGCWDAEEKYDGIRIITEISDHSDQLFVNKGVTAWSRYGNLRPHPTHIAEILARFPNCVIDGELIAPGKRSYGTMELANTPELVYYIFDLLHLDGEDVMPAPRSVRREALIQIFNDAVAGMGSLSGVGFLPVQIAPSTRVNTWDEIYALRDAIWARDGEGLILKRHDSCYIPSKRSKDWIKIKQLRPACLTVIGFTESRGEKVYRGPYGMTQLRDDEGNITAVKTRTDADCRRFEELGRNLKPGELHPDVGRKLWVEYQERTPDGSYRHIRWDHWDGE